MYYLAGFISKLFSQLHIPSEREIRDLQLRQVKRAHKQMNNSEKNTIDAPIKFDQRLCQSTMPFSNKSEMINSNEFEEAS